VHLLDKTIEDPDAVAARKERRRQVAANETSPAGDQNLLAHDRGLSD
jgi:hypothetical protein